MKFNHCDMYNHLLTRKCECGGDGEMLIDFVADFEARCSKCHRSTHAYIKPEDAAKHWNAGDDIMPHPLHIFWDDPEGYLKGDIVSIFVSNRYFECISPQSCDCEAAIFEYADGTYLVFEHVQNGETGAISIHELSAFNTDIYNRTIAPSCGKIIRFEKIIYSESGDIDGIAFRWGDTWLFVFTSEYNLILTRSSFDLSDPNGWPEAPVEPTLFC